jgi:hypothetical protein
MVAFPYPAAVRLTCLQLNTEFILSFVTKNGLKPSFFRKPFFLLKNPVTFRSIDKPENLEHNDATTPSAPVML